MTPLLAALILSGVPPQILNNADYIVIDVHSREVLASNWEDASKPIPVGSLVKPFTALAHGAPFPAGFEKALAESSNPYFLDLARETSAEALGVVAQKYSIPSPALDSAETRVGLGKGWQIPPLALLRAYAEMSQRSGEPAVAAILRGLAEGARSGTSSAIGAGVLAKTGTAPCVEKRHHAGDGFSLVLDPTESPRIALLVRVHNVPGKEAAKTAAQILRAVRSQM
jgi:cell division protein FtsI/penicillin-binding protein 2